MEETRDEIYAAWAKEQPKEFLDLVDVHNGTNYRINAPCMTKKGFGFNELNQVCPLCLTHEEWRERDEGRIFRSW